MNLILNFNFHSTDEEKGSELPSNFPQATQLTINNRLDPKPGVVVAVTPDTSKAKKQLKAGYRCRDQGNKTRNRGRKQLLTCEGLGRGVLRK